MRFHELWRRWLIYIVIAVAALAAIWSAAMLIGGFRAAGQLDSEWNPFGGAVAFFAAAAIIGATAVFYYVIASRTKVPRYVMAISATIVVVLTIFASITQLFLVVDSAMGKRFVLAVQVVVDQAWQRLLRIDQTMVGTYLAQIDFYALRMEEELKTGKGPLFKGAKRSYDTLRAEYGAVLGQTNKAVQQGRSLSGDAEGAKAYRASLRGKVLVFERFSAAEGIATENLAEQLNAVEVSLADLGESTFIDRKSLVYATVVEKIGQMLRSFGFADLGFTLAALLSITPDLIQILCTCLISFLGPRARREAETDDEGNVSPFDVFGQRAADPAE